MADEYIPRPEYEARKAEVDRRLADTEEWQEKGLARLEKMIGDGFAGVHRRQDIANGRVAKVEATCAERGRTCPGLARSAAGIVISPKLAVGIVVGVLILAIAAVAGPGVVAAFLERAF